MTFNSIMEDVSPQRTTSASSTDGNDRSRSLSAAMVFEKTLIERNGCQSPVVRNFARHILKKWRDSKERAISKRLQEVKIEKKRREAESKEVARLITRTIPLDVLANEWMNDNELTAGVRTYLVEKLLPTLILGVEKLLKEVTKRDLADSEGFCPDFNPINYLAQYLMRNNPRYSNFIESSPYAKGLHKIITDLKKEIYSTEENKLAKLKAEARKKRKGREMEERLRDAEERRRSNALEEQFIEWTSDWKGMVPLAVMQNTLLSFQELAASFSDEVKKGADFCIPLEPTDTSGRVLDMDAYKQYMKPYAGNISATAFELFMNHLSACAKEYRAATLRQTLQMMLQNLFLVCDVNRVGQLDRKRILELLGTFYDKAPADDRENLRNPREWPVIEIEETSSEDETINIDEEQLGPIEEKETKTTLQEETKAYKEEFSEKEKPKDAVYEIQHQNTEDIKESGKPSLVPTDQEEKKGQRKNQEEQRKEEQAKDQEEQRKEEQTKDQEEQRKEEQTKDQEEQRKDREDNELEQEDKEKSQEYQAKDQEDQEKNKESKTEEQEGQGKEQEGQEKEQEGQEKDKDDEEGQDKSQDAQNEQRERQKVKEKDDKSEEMKDNTQNETKEQEKHDDLSEEDKKLLNSIPDEYNSSEGTESQTTASGVYKLDTQSIVEGSAFDESYLNQSQFIHLTEKFLGDVPNRQLLEKLVRFIRSHYIEVDYERLERMNKAREDAYSDKKRKMIDQLFELWDVDMSNYIEIDKIQVVLDRWTNDNGNTFPEAYKIFSEVTSKLDLLGFRECINAIEVSDGENSFEALIQFLMACVERSFEERRRSETRKRWLAGIDAAAQTSGANLDPVYSTIFQILYKDAEEHGRGKTISAFVSMLENNEDFETISRGETVLRYVACTQEDIAFMLGKVIYRNMKAVSWAAVDTGKPIHVPKVGSHGGVQFWNPSRKPENADGSFIVLPVKDHEKRVIGLLGIDTLNDAHKTTFITHEISFYQGIAKALGQAIQFIDVRKKTLRVAESAVQWILRRSQNVLNVNVYLVEPGLRAADGLVLRRMMLMSHNTQTQKFNNPTRLERKDNLFRDYLFKCVESSETITADAYGERHMAFPLRDAEGHAVAVVDISIGSLKALPPHENKEIQRMLRLLAMAHREVAREVAGMEKNIVLEIEKEHEEARIDVLFDRLMLLDLRENVGRLDARAFAEIKSYKDPPKVIHDILKAVLGIFNTDSKLQERFDEWTTCKQYVNQDLVRNLTSYDPTAKEHIIKVDAKSLAKILQDVPQGAVAKHGSLPAQYLFNWAFVCLSLIEHTDKMTETRPGKAISPHATSSPMIDHGKGRRDSPAETMNTTSKTGTD